MNEDLKQSEMCALGRLMILMGFIGIIAVWFMERSAVGLDIGAWEFLQPISLVLLTVGAVITVYCMFRK